MIYLHKILPIIALPIGLTILLVAAGLLLRRRGLCWLGLALLWVASMPLAGDAAMRAAEGGQVRRALHEIPPARAIVVLSNAPVIPPGDSSQLEWDDDVDRFAAGVALYQAGKAPLLILTGGWLPWRPANRPAGEVLAASAVAQGIPGDRVRVTGRVMNTAAEAQAVAQLLQDEVPAASGPVILVTSAFHMRRSAWLFRQAGVDVIPYPVDFRVPAGRVFTLLDLLPAAASLAKTEIALREWYGYLYYRLRD